MTGPASSSSFSAIGSPHGERRQGEAQLPADHTVIKLFSGDFFVTDQPRHVIVTVLGSCISACIRDPVAQVGGMNHFLLPATNSDLTIDHSDAARYGAFAMEALMNNIIQRGGLKSRLEVKVFGGGNVMDSNLLIGSKNVTFTREYLAREGLLITSSDLGGTYPRRIHYYPDSGKVMMRCLQRKEDMRVAEEEKRFAASLAKAPMEGDVDLF